MKSTPKTLNNSVGFIFFVKLNTNARNRIMMLIALHPSEIPAIFSPFTNRLIKPLVGSVIELV